MMFFFFFTSFLSKKRGKEEWCWKHHFRDKRSKWSVGWAREWKIWKNAKFCDGWKCCLSRGQAHPTIGCLDIIATVRPDTWLRIVPMWTQEEEVDRTGMAAFSRRPCVIHVNRPIYPGSNSYIYFDNFFFIPYY